MRMVDIIAVSPWPDDELAVRVFCFRTCRPRGLDFELFSMRLGDGIANVKSCAIRKLFDRLAIITGLCSTNRRQSMYTCHPYS